MRTSGGIWAALLVGTCGGCEPLEMDDGAHSVSDAAHDMAHAAGAEDAARATDGTHPAGAAPDGGRAHDADSDAYEEYEPDDGADAGSDRDARASRGDAARDCRYFDASIDATVGTEDCSPAPLSCSYFGAAVDATVMIGDCSTELPHDSGHNDPLDPGTIARVDCGSVHRSSNVRLSLQQTTLWENNFEVSVHQTFPTTVELTFTQVHGSWSGHFFNFNDDTSLAPLRFHLLTRGQPDDADNVEVYTDDISMGSVNASQLNCTLVRNP